MTTETLNPMEAPRGYRAVLKATAKEETLGANICRACDWRGTCQRSDTDFFALGHRCMSYEITQGEKVYQRKDGCSVVFKKIAVRYEQGRLELGGDEGLDRLYPQPIFTAYN